MNRVDSEKTFSILIAAAVIFAVIFGGLFLTAQGYKNRAISLEEGIQESGSNIQTIVQKRVDTLTQLTNTVKDSKKFEAEVLVGLTKARTEAERGDFAASESSLRAVAEAYPEIKTIDLYDNLMITTATIENQLSNSRQVYNRDVAEYNKLIRKFPSSQLLGLAGYKPLNFEPFIPSEAATGFNPSEDNLFGDN